MDAFSRCVSSGFSRKSARRRSPWTLAALLLLVSAVLSAQSAANYLIGPKDVLSVQVFDQPDLGGKYTVEADGTFSFPLIGRVTAAGLSLRAFETS